MAGPSPSGQTNNDIQNHHNNLPGDSTSPSRPSSKSKNLEEKSHSETTRSTRTGKVPEDNCNRDKDTITSEESQPIPSSIHSQNDEEDGDEPYPTMTVALFIYWVLPIVLLSIFGRRGVDTRVPRIPVDPTPPGSTSGIAIAPKDIEKAYLDYERKKKEFEQQQQNILNKNNYNANNGASQLEKKKKPQQTEAAPITLPKSPSSDPSITSGPSIGVDTSAWPTSYISVVNQIRSQRPQWHHGPPLLVNEKATNHQKQRQDGGGELSSSETMDASHDETLTGGRGRFHQQRNTLKDKIEELKEEYERDKTDVFKALEYADTMRQFGLKIFDGGSYDQRAIGVYTSALVQLRQHRTAAQQQGIPTDENVHGQRNVPSELELSYKEKSIDGLLCAVYTALGKLYFMANMFELSERVYSNCCDIEPYYLDALNARGSTRIIMGKYHEAASDYALVLTKDVETRFTDAFTGMVRVLEADAASVPTGWSFIVGRLQDTIGKFESALVALADSQFTPPLVDGLRRFHHGLFVYHDKKTKDYAAAWEHLSASHKYKLMSLPPYSFGSEKMKVEQLRQVFGKGFWPDGMGSSTKIPIFVIGFARSGSTLLERVLSAHPQIAGLGENSVFNGRLDSIRQRFVEASAAGGYQIPTVAREMAKEVVTAMKEQWENIERNTARDGNRSSDGTPARFVDKMLTNYFNIGFIQMMFPQALILHVIREPMDTIFSAFKHDFPADRLAYTANAEALAEIYTVYRDTMAHWEDVLPGRITHVRYEDMVEDMPGVARAIINAAGLSWDESVLDFHNQKHYVNTYSSTQVRKQVYKDAVKSWKHYEEQLGELVDLLGEYVSYDQQTRLPGYERPVADTSHILHDEP